MTEKLTTKDEQTFCLYCQRHFKTPGNLARHILLKHKGTYAEVNVVQRAKAIDG